MSAMRAGIEIGNHRRPHFMVLCALPEANLTQRDPSRSVSAFFAERLSVRTLSMVSPPYSERMKWNNVALFISIMLNSAASNGPAAEPNWTGEYADKNFLNGRAVFEMSVTQSGNAVQIAFDAAYNDAHGATPDGEGQGRITGKNAVEFKWEDSFKNSGTGSITSAGKEIVVSMNTTRIVDSRCLVFYGKNMR